MSSSEDFSLFSLLSVIATSVVIMGGIVYSVVTRAHKTEAITGPLPLEVQDLGYAGGTSIRCMIITIEGQRLLIVNGDGTAIHALGDKK